MLLLVKFRNAAELLWDSLDSQERMILLYIVGTVAVSLLSAGAKRSRDQLKEEIKQEIADAR